MGKTYKDQRKFAEKVNKREAKVYECPQCDGVHDHQIGWVKGVHCPDCGSTMVEVMKVKRD